MALGSRAPAASEGIRLRPMGIGDVLDETFRVYRRQFLPFVVAMALVEVPLTLVGVAFNVAVGVAGTQGWLDRLFTPAGSLRTEELAALAVSLFAIGAVVAIVFGLVSAVRMGAAIALASDAALGRPSAVLAAYRSALRRLPSLLWAGFLSVLAFLLLFITLIGIPVAIFFAVRWSLAYQAVMVEGRGGWAALGRSWSLVGGHSWRAFVVLLLLWLLTWLLVSIPSGLVGFGLQLVAGANPSIVAQTAINVVNTLASALGQVLFGAIGFIAMTVLYYDLRVRKEAFDLEQRVEQAEAGPVDAGGASDAPAPPAERG